MPRIINLNENDFKPGVEEKLFIAHSADEKRLFQLIEKGNIDEIKKLPIFNSKDALNRIVNENGQSPLLLAVELRNKPGFKEIAKEIVIFLIQNSFHTNLLVSYNGKNYDTPLHVIAQNNDIELAEIFAAQTGILTKFTNKAHLNKNTALYDAIEKGNLEVTEILISKLNSNINVKSCDFPIKSLIKKNKIDAIKYFKELALTGISIIGDQTIKILEISNQIEFLKKFNSSFYNADLINLALDHHHIDVAKYLLKDFISSGKTELVTKALDHYSSQSFHSHEYKTLLQDVDLISYIFDKKQTDIAQALIKYILISNQTELVKNILNNPEISLNKAFFIKNVIDAINTGNINRVTLSVLIKFLDTSNDSRKLLINAIDEMSETKYYTLFTSISSLLKIPKNTFSEELKNSFNLIIQKKFIKVAETGDLLLCEDYKKNFEIDEKAIQEGSKKYIEFKHGFEFTNSTQRLIEYMSKFEGAEELSVNEIAKLEKELFNIDTFNDEVLYIGAN